MSGKIRKSDNERLQRGCKELSDLINEALASDGTLEILPGVSLTRLTAPLENLHSVAKPAFCVIAQGSKEVLLGDEVFRYDRGHFMIYTLDLPIVSRIGSATISEPYLSFRLDLDASLVGSVMMDCGYQIRNGEANTRAIDVQPTDADLLDAVVRLVRCKDDDAEQKILGPLIIREIVYRLLVGKQGASLGHIVSLGGHNSRISKAVEHLRERFASPLRMEELAHELGMSVSGFHHHFKSVTAMSPLQFQKQLRLQEARRLMLGEDLDAASAGFRVGYDDPSHFSREYKRHFGAPPQRDIARLRDNIS